MCVADRRFHLRASDWWKQQLPRQGAETGQGVGVGKCCFGQVIFQMKAVSLGALGWALTHERLGRSCWSPQWWLCHSGGHCYPKMSQPCVELGFELLLVPARHIQFNPNSAGQGCSRQDTGAAQELSWALALRAVMSWGLGSCVSLAGIRELDRTSSIFQALAADIPCSPWCWRQTQPFQLSEGYRVALMLSWECLTCGMGSTSFKSVLLVSVNCNVLAKISIPALKLLLLPLEPCVFRVPDSVNDTWENWVDPVCVLKVNKMRNGF